MKQGNPNGIAATNRTETNPLAKLPSISEKAIDKDLADRARELAALPEPEIEQAR